MLAENTETSKNAFLDPVISICRTFGRNVLKEYPQILEVPMGDPSKWVPEFAYSKGNCESARRFFETPGNPSVEQLIVPISTCRFRTEHSNLLLSLPKDIPWLTGSRAISTYIAWALEDDATNPWKCPVDLEFFANVAATSYALASVGSYEYYERAELRAKAFRPKREEVRLFEHACGISEAYRACAKYRAKVIYRDWNSDCLRAATEQGREFLDYGYKIGSHEDYRPKDLNGEFCELGLLPECVNGRPEFCPISFFRAGTLFVVHLKKGNRVLFLRESDVGDIRRLLEEVGIAGGYWRAYHQELGKGEIQLGRDISTASKQLYRFVRELHRFGSLTAKSSTLVGPLCSLVADTIDSELAGTRWVDNVKRVKVKVRDKVGEPPEFWSDYLAYIRRLPLKERVEFSEVKKFSILPMYCPYSIMTDQELQYQAKNKTGGEPGSEQETIYQEFLLYERWLDIGIVRKAKGGTLYPGKIRPEALPKPWHKEYVIRGIPERDFADSGDVDLTGVLDLYLSDEAVLLSCEDKTMCPSTIRPGMTEKDISDCPIWDRKMLMWALQCPEPKSMQEILDEWPEYMANVMVGQRLEYKKDKGRMFFSAMFVYRAIMSVLERHWETLLKYFPGNLLAQTTKFKIKAFQELCRPGGPNALLESTDMDKFSPHMDRRYHDDLGKRMAELYGRPELREIYTPMVTARINSRAYGRMVNFQNGGSNFEGMNAKANTARHSAIGAYIRYKANEEGWLLTFGPRLVFVDDAGCSSQVAGMDEEERQRNYREYRDFRRKAYRSISWEESEDKNYESDVFAVLLNDRRYKGEPLRQGMKAALSFASYDPVAVETLGTRSASCFAVAQGVSSSGGPIEWATYFYHFKTLTYMELMAPRSSKPLAQAEIALFAVTPMSMGGLGLVGSLCLDSNVAGPTGANSLATLVKLGQTNPHLYDIVNNILNQELEELSDLDWMRDPGQFRVVGPRIQVMRTRAACISAARKSASNPWLLKYLEEASVEQMEEIASGMRSLATVNRKIVEQIWSSSRVAKVESILGKFQNADCITSLLPKRVIGRLRIAARSDIFQVLRYWRHRMRGEELPLGVRKSREG